MENVKPRGEYPRIVPKTELQRYVMISSLFFLMLVMPFMAFLKATPFWFRMIVGWIKYYFWNVLGAYEECLKDILFIWWYEIKKR